MVHFDLKLADSLSTLLHCTTDFGKEIDGRWLSLCEDVDMVRRHAFLRNEHLFGAVDDEVPSGVVWTFVQIKELALLEFAQDAER